MKSILIVGIGRFGRFLAIKLASLKNEVMIVDKSEAAINEVLPYVTTAQIADFSNEQVVKSTGVSNFDVCVVAIGDDFQASLVITSLLKENGAKYVIAKASRLNHAKFLLKNGADEIVYPEKELAERLAVKLSAKNVFEYIELSDDYAIYEIPPLKSWVGKSIAQKGIRSKYNINILAIKQEGIIYPNPDPEFVFTGKEHLVVMGRKKDIEKTVD
ncbi:MAG: TrkA family potassium uptake protein [Oscillospiraceae bacterium]|nr:TrkA family potassium uptake protein [Oscillospiraceae bacterium]